MKNIRAPFFPIHAGSAANQTDTIIIPARSERQAVIKRLRSVGGHATSATKFYPARASGLTKVYTTAAYTATAIALTGDAGVGKTLRGRVVTVNDFFLVNTILHGWRLYVPSVLSATADGKINATTIAAFDRVAADISATAGDGIVAGQAAYVIWLEDVISYLIGAATLDQQYPAAGVDCGHPLGISILAGDATAHNVNGVAEYV